VSTPSAYLFGPFRLDADERVLLRGPDAIPLTPKLFDTLHVLVAAHGRIVDKPDLMKAIWPDTFVEEGNLTFNISTLRKILTREGGQARYIETVPRRGYRFAAPVQVVTTSKAPAAEMPAGRVTVGRDAERAELDAALAAAASGRGSFVAIAGEAGLGKTTLIAEFLGSATALPRRYRVGRGRSFERLTGAEAYSPFLEALDDLLARDDGTVAGVLARLAPAWHALVMPHGAGAQGSAASQERLTRELVVALHELSRVDPLILVFDDVHWADASTVDLLGYIGARLPSMRVLMLAAFRRSELERTRHPLLRVKLELQGRGICHEIALDFLTPADVEAYLDLEFAGHDFPPGFSRAIHERTGGNPLFMVDLLRYLRERQVLDRTSGRWILARSLPDLRRDLPESVRSILQRKIDDLADGDRMLLLAASVEGYQFESTIGADALGEDALAVEERLERLHRMHAFVRPLGEVEFPDRTVGLRYQFVHVLYQDALDACLTPARRAALSGSVAQALEARYGDRHGEVAARLALLFDAGRDADRASRYYLLAARNAARLFASHEAIPLARRGLELLTALPDGPARAEREIELQMTLGLVSMFVKGWSAPEVEQAYSRARALCQQLGETLHLFPVLFGLWLFHGIRADMAPARDLGEQLVRLATAAEHPGLLMVAHQSLGATLMDSGELADALDHFERAIAAEGPNPARGEPAGPMDPGVAARCFAARVLWPLGHPDRALARATEALTIAESIGHVQSRALALTFAAITHHLRGEVAETRARAEAAIELSAEYGLAQSLAWGRLWRGWALTEQGQVDEGFADMEAAVAAYRAMGSGISLPQFLGLLAEAHRKAGRLDAGFALIEEALAQSQRSGDHYFDAELHRLHGRLLLARATSDRAEARAAFLRAIEVARAAGARAWELHATLELLRASTDPPHRRDAAHALGALVSRFTEGLDTPLVGAARAELAIG